MCTPCHGILLWDKVKKQKRRQKTRRKMWRGCMYILCKHNSGISIGIKNRIRSYESTHARIKYEAKTYTNGENKFRLWNLPSIRVLFLIIRIYTRLCWGRRVCGLPSSCGRHNWSCSNGWKFNQNHISQDFESVCPHAHFEFTRPFSLHTLR